MLSKDSLDILSDVSLIAVREPNPPTSHIIANHHRHEFAKNDAR
jgi:hypothetical protein